MLCLILGLHRKQENDILTLGTDFMNENNPNEVPSFGKLFIRNLFLIIWPIEFIVHA